MISFFRGLSETWVARIFFALLVAAFALWGIGDVLRVTGSGNALATVGDRKIEPAEFQDAFRRDMQQVTRMMGSAEPTPAIRRTVAQQTLERLIYQYAIANEVGRLGIVVPDDVLRQVVTAAPAFRGPSGNFDRATFDTVMRNNGLSEQRFLELSRGELAQGQLLGAVGAGVATPSDMLAQLYKFQNQTRGGEIVELPFVAAPQPGTPTADDLQRQYENNPASYSAPEYRRVKLVVLAPSIIAKGIAVSDEEARAYYDQHRAEYEAGEQRAAQVITSGDEAKARALAAQWQGGVDWAAMQAAAQRDGASALTLDLSTRAQIPSAELADAVFAAAPDTVIGPVKSALAWQVLRVTKVQPGVSRSFDQVKDEVKAKLATDRATDEVFTRANKLDDALSAGTSLDDLPGDLGLAALTGTLDAQGDTPEGDKAPLPGGDGLRDAIIKAAFAANKGEAPHMVEAPDQSYYALQVEDVIPGKVKPFDQVSADVAQDWDAAQRRHAEDEAAAKLMAAARAANSLDDAATVAGLRVRKTAPVTRSGTAEGVPVQVQQALFSLKVGETTMVETPDGFIVVRLADLHDPDPTGDPANAARLRESLDRDLQRDVILAFAGALHERVQPKVNTALLNSLVE